jgi:pilus assembly protein Flp/PilA
MVPVTDWSKEASMQKLVSLFMVDESGATAIEYALIASGIAVAIVVAVQSLGTTLNTTYASVSLAL